MITREMEDLKFICDNCYGGSLKLMAVCYEKVIRNRKETGDTQNIALLEKDLETIKNMENLTNGEKDEIRK